MSSGLGNYDATASATGYLYQCRLALFTGVRAIAETPNLELSIEHFDDVAFEQGGEPIQLIQAKHHVSKKGTLTDASSDLWKTLRIWAERVAQDGEAPFSTSFVLMTTGAAPDGSAAGHLRARDRNEEKAHELLVTAATTSKSETNKKSTRHSLIYRRKRGSACSVRFWFWTDRRTSSTFTRNLATSCVMLWRRTTFRCSWSASKAGGSARSSAR